MLNVPAGAGNFDTADDCRMRPCVDYSIGLMRISTFGIPLTSVFSRAMSVACST